jgi:hypothetical protein
VIPQGTLAKPIDFGRRASTTWIDQQQAIWQALRHKLSTCSGVVKFSRFGRSAVDPRKALAPEFLGQLGLGDGRSGKASSGRRATADRAKGLSLNPAARPRTRAERFAQAAGVGRADDRSSGCIFPARRREANRRDAFTR